ncbi:uncharacterized protein LOC106069290 [Biomphalaria glabrata]|uniref:Uncharacterized protein LOC106069290 n=1 Tax=Biomphalaria glabrata TaxID=6526 RepID=A0A9W2YK10_BIOGL|nr:uncharacterized protein LOC106069290 [Biomphalaria glabrata]XP_055863063.1 uncharacterized protein LOC106069290 [Biomphalaria glabrata]XP_055863064.1 uncharacterized protein LOC106069290 [Biomphalaria glabrata]
MKIFIATLLVAYATAQLSIPRQELGFVYKDGRSSASVKLASYIDLTCPDSQAAFPTLLQVADSFSGEDVQLKFYLFSLPYHRNSHLISKATRFLDGFAKNSTANATVFDWIKAIYNNIDSLTTTATLNSTEIQVFDFLTNLAKTLFPVSADQFKKGAYSADIDSVTRLEWKYGCTRGVYGTPLFTVNDVFVNADPTWPASKWIELIKSVLPSNRSSAQQLLIGRNLK